MSPHPQIQLDFLRFPEPEMQRRSASFYEEMNRRRSVRFFSDQAVDRRLIENAIRTAGTAPSGAHRQPWRFVAINDPAIKHEVRVAAEKEEKESYEERMSEEWLQALAPIGTTWQKPFLETVPWIVVCFAELYGMDEDGNRIKNYYVQESCGIACGMFISAIHHMGLATLTHTPSPMKFLNEILGRPRNEKPYILFPVGYPSKDAVVPDFDRKPLSEISQWNRSPQE